MLTLEGTAFRHDLRMNRVQEGAENIDEQPKHTFGSARSREAAVNPKINRENHQTCQVK